MVRKRFHLISIALLSLALSPAFANASLADETPLALFQGAGEAVLSTQQMASADLGTGLSPASSTAIAAAPSDQSIAAPAGRLIDYPALVLLAIAIICMAALSRRDVEVGLKEGNG